MRSLVDRYQLLFALLLPCWTINQSSNEKVFAKCGVIHKIMKVQRMQGMCKRLRLYPSIQSFATRCTGNMRSFKEPSVIHYQYRIYISQIYFFLNKPLYPLRVLLCSHTPFTVHTHQRLRTRGRHRHYTSFHGLESLWYNLLLLMCHFVGRASIPEQRRHYIY